MELVFYGFENENIMKTKEEILKEATKRTLNIIEGSPLHDAVMKAMEEYVQQQVKNYSIPAVVGQSEQLESGLTCMMCRKPKENDGHTCCEECAGLPF